MAAQPWAIGTRAVLAWFDDNVDDDSPYWSLWVGSQLMGSFKSGDLNMSRQKLHTNLESFEQAGMSQAMTLRLHDIPDGGKISNKSEYYSSFNFSPVGVGQTGMISGGMMSFPNNPNLQALYDKLQSQESRIVALEALLAEDDDAAVSGVPNNPWMAMMASPEFQSAAAERIFGIIDRIIPGPAAPMGSIGQIPGADPQDQYAKANQAIQILSQLDPQLGDDLMRLATLAQTNRAQFEMLLTMLRANG